MQVHNSLTEFADQRKVGEIDEMLNGARQGRMDGRAGMRQVVHKEKIESLFAP